MDHFSGQSPTRCPFAHLSGTFKAQNSRRYAIGSRYFIISIFLNKQHRTLTTEVNYSGH